MIEKTQEVQAPPYQLDHHTPQPQFAPQAQWQPPVQPPAQALSAAQVGEQYRSAQFAQCAQGNHQRETKYGVCGIITAVVLFPIGLICLFMDKEEVCSRCGNKM